MNNTDNNSIAKLYESSFPYPYSIHGQTSVEEFKQNYQSTVPYSQTTHHACWGQTLVRAIECNHVELIKHIVGVCGKQIFAYHHRYCLLPICYATTAKVAEFLIDLGADLNIVSINESPLEYVLITELKNENERLQIVKCFIKNHAAFNTITGPRKKIIDLALKEIELVNKGILFAASSINEKSILFETQIPHDIITLIFQKMINGMVS